MSMTFIRILENIEANAAVLTDVELNEVLYASTAAAPSPFTAETFTRYMDTYRALAAAGRDRLALIHLKQIFSGPAKPVIQGASAPSFAEALTIITLYTDASDFWKDYFAKPDTSKSLREVAEARNAPAILADESASA